MVTRSTFTASVEDAAADPVTGGLITISVTLSRRRTPFERRQLRDADPVTLTHRTTSFERRSPLRRQRTGRIGRAAGPDGRSGSRAR